MRRSGHLDISMAMRLSQYLKQETDYIPWSVALSCFSYIDSLLMGTDTYKYFTVCTKINMRKNHSLSVYFYKFYFKFNYVVVPAFKTNYLGQS